MDESQQNSYFFDKHDLTIHRDLSKITQIESAMPEGLPNDSFMREMSRVTACMQIMHCVQKTKRSEIA